MEYLHCERCGLDIKVQAAYLRLDNCPRCLGRGAIVSPLVTRALDGSTQSATEDRRS